LTIGTRNVVLDAAAVRRGAPAIGDYAAIHVTDTGCGMTPDVVARIFDPFFTTKTRADGAGLGLTTVYSFVKKCRGHIDVVSEPGQGTTFSVYLPRSVRLRSKPPGDLPRSVGAKTSSTILVVDEDASMRGAIEKVLERAGYHVLVASGSAEAVDIVHQHGSRISLVILDMMTPGMTGPELGRRLVELQLRIPVLFVSGSAPDSPGSDEPASSGLFLKKPFELSELLLRVRSLLDAA
jgi:two-component system, cell cycle sensor histidine kinase and response regulator CckA